MNNVKQLYEFDLVYSEDLGKQNYSGVDLHCCFNIYKRPSSGVLNNKPKLIEIDGLEVIEYRRGGHNISTRVNKDYYKAICAWGDVGASVKTVGDYVKELYFITDCPRIKSVIDSIDWKCEIKGISAKNLTMGLALEIIQSKLNNKNPL